MAVPLRAPPSPTHRRTQAHTCFPSWLCLCSFNKVSQPPHPPLNQKMRGCRHRPWGRGRGAGRAYTPSSANLDAHVRTRVSGSETPALEVVSRSGSSEGYPESWGCRYRKKPCPSPSKGQVKTSTVSYSVPQTERLPSTCLISLPALTKGGGGMGAGWAIGPDRRKLSRVT